MNIDDDRSANFVADFHSKPGEVYVPLAVAAVPAGLFMLLGFITKRLVKPGAEVPSWVDVAVVVLLILGMIAMAFVILTRFELGMRNLMNFTDGHPHVLQKLTLMFSFACLLLFDVVINVAAAFPGAGGLAVGAVPVFLAYLVLNRVAFAGFWLCPP